MNNPIDHGDDLESRIDKLERDMKQVKSTLEHIKLDTGGARESLDTIERRQVETNRLLRGIVQVQADYGERLDILARGQQELKQELHAHAETWLESLQENFNEIKAEIQTAQGTQNERFDRIEMAMATKDDVATVKQDIAALKATQDEHGSLLREILNRLPPKQ